MDLREGTGMAVLMGVLLLGPAPAHAGDVTQRDFSVGWELHLIGGRDTAVKGYVDNRSASAADGEDSIGPPAASPAVP